MLVYLDVQKAWTKKQKGETKWESKSITHIPLPEDK
jgi:hypothetical protein